MMRSFLLSLGLLTAAFLAGCGFTPMHGSAANGTRLADVTVQLDKGKKVADDQAGFFITQRLRDRIGDASAASPYTLKITPKYTRRRLGLTDGDVASRYDVTVTAIWELTETKTGDILDKGLVSAISTFGAPAGPYGVITADNVGVEQAAQETADKLVLKIAQHFAAQK